MNIYLVVEGNISEKYVYQEWLRYVNGSLRVVNSLDEIDDDSVYIVSGGGYPSYLSVINDGVQDVHDNGLDRLVIAVDSEDQTYQEKKSEIENYIESLGFNIDYKIIVQHFCIEAWALGNKSLIRRKPQCPTLSKFLNIHNVVDEDPELLPANNELDLNRAQFAELYLRRAVNERFSNLTYKKSNPKVLMDKAYFNALVDRLNTTNHISSFHDFLDAFV